MIHHPASEILTRAQCGGDALRALITRTASDELTEQQRLDLSVALDAVRRAMGPLGRSADEAIRRNAGRLAAALAESFSGSP